LKFQSKDVDPDTGVVGDPFDDEYKTEGIDIFVGDYVSPSRIDQFDQLWASLPCECVETFMVPTKSVKETVDMLALQIGLKCLDRIQEQARVSLRLGGFVFGNPVVGKVDMIVNPKEGVTMQLAVKSGHEEVSETIANGVQ
jgi:hypothetical protein